MMVSLRQLPLLLPLLPASNSYFVESNGELFDAGLVNPWY
jgi:hypothetical protein